MIEADHQGATLLASALLGERVAGLVSAEQRRRFSLAAGLGRP